MRGGASRDVVGSVSCAWTMDAVCTAVSLGFERRLAA
jgi:hypothetical protein